MLNRSYSILFLSTRIIYINYNHSLISIKKHQCQTDKNELVYLQEIQFKLHAGQINLHMNTL